MKTLFCIIGNLRGGDLPYQSFVDNFGDTVDLALCVGNTYKESKYRNIAKYIWEIDESNDIIWETIYDSVSTKWRDLNHIENLWGPYKGLAGSGMIICSFRQILYQQLLKIEDISKYDRFVLTRADHVYVNNFLPEVESGKIYLPEGEECGGVTDRFSVAKYPEFMKSLQIIDFIQNNPYLLTNNVVANNVEKYLKQFYEFTNLDIVKYKRNMFTVARTNEQTRWKGSKERNGRQLHNFKRIENNVNYVYKYISEYKLIQSYK
jgi:hypothetical protein